MRTPALLSKLSGKRVWYIGFSSKVIKEEEKIGDIGFSFRVIQIHNHSYFKRMWYLPKSAGWNIISGTRKRSLVKSNSCQKHEDLNLTNKEKLGIDSKVWEFTFFVRSILFLSSVFSDTSSSITSFLTPSDGDETFSSDKERYLLASSGFLTKPLVYDTPSGRTYVHRKKFSFPDFLHKNQWQTIAFIQEWCTNKPRST